ncbi:MAG: hypothetical protein RSC99_10030 [Clostridiales bacterium]
MKNKIESYFARTKLGKIKEIIFVGNWSQGDLYRVKTTRWLHPNEFTIYELDGEIKTVRSLQTNKIY